MSNGNLLNKVKKLKKLSLAEKQVFHFDLNRAKEYEDAHDYRSRTFDWMVKTIRPMLSGVGSALDVGTGTGDLVRAIKINGVFTGMDVSEDMLKVAREKCGRQGNFVCGDAYALPFDDGIFEAVVYKYALHHLDDPVKSLKEALRVLKKGGLIIIADVASFEDKEHHLIFKKLNTLREPANYEYRAIKIISDLLIDVGFTKMKVQKKEFDLVLEDWLNHFYESQKTIPFVLSSSESFRKAIKLKLLTDNKHQVSLTSFVAVAQKK